MIRQKLLRNSAALRAGNSSNEKFDGNKEITSAFVFLKGRLTSQSVILYRDFSLPFVVDIDASKISFGAALSQRKKKEVSLTQCASYRMDYLERAHSARENEALAVIFALRKCHVHSLIPGTLA